VSIPAKFVPTVTLPVCVPRCRVGVGQQQCEEGSNVVRGAAPWKMNFWWILVIFGSKIFIFQNRFLGEIWNFSTIFSRSFMSRQEMNIHECKHIWPLNYWPVRDLEEKLWLALHFAVCVRVKCHVSFPCSSINLPVRVSLSICLSMFFRCLIKSFRSSLLL